MPIEHNPDYIHHQNQKSASTLREMVFGMEDGMVSTLGAVTGIAAATLSHFTVVLSGLVIVSVESISMAVGSYLSSKSARALNERKLKEEKTELDKFPKEEKEELMDMYIIDGWPKKMAETMAEEASKNKDLFLQEMAYRELGIVPENLENPIKNGAIMWVSYVLGGSIPVFPYFFLPVVSAIPISIIITLIALFILGAYTGKHTKRSWWKSGLEMLGLASAAALVGYLVGQGVERFFA